VPDAVSDRLQGEHRQHAAAISYRGELDLSAASLLLLRMTLITTRAALSWQIEA